MSKDLNMLSALGLIRPVVVAELSRRVFKRIQLHPPPLAAFGRNAEILAVPMSFQGAK